MTTKERKERKLSPQTWVATDGLGRTVENSYADTRRQGKYVGLFFHTWHSPHLHVDHGFGDISDILEAHPDIGLNDYSDPRWGNYPVYFWDEPIWGYYRSADEWVLRRQAELFAAADIDVVFCDNTNNRETFLNDALTLLETWSKARADGVKTPAVSFMLPMFDFNDAAAQLRELYREIFGKGLYRDLWFDWKGKPLILAYPGQLNREDPLDREILDFFQFRVISHAQSTDYVQVKDPATGEPLVMAHNGLFTDNGFQVWNWISAYPQIVNRNPDGTPEEMAVSVSQNWSKEGHLTAFSNPKDTVFSRDYIPDEDRYDERENAAFYGAYFEAQWNYALEVDPEFIYITGWNEWTAGRYPEYWGVTNAFIDQFTSARSRDIEPTKGPLKDHYYYQMVSFIRKFKGTDAAVKEPPHTVDISADRDPWEAVETVYPSYAGNTFRRNAKGYLDLQTGKHLVYTDDSGRNDIVACKAAYDDRYVTLMAETKEDLTPYTDPAWMRLFLEVVSVDGRPVKAENWESFSYVVNRLTPESESVTTLEASTGGWNWKTVGRVVYRAVGNRIAIQIPREMLGLGNGDFVLNFKWSDNMKEDGNVMDFYLHGDTAPNGRFKYPLATVSE